MIDCFLLLSRQGKLRLAKWYTSLSAPVKAKTVRDVSQLVLGRRPRMCGIIEYKGRKVVYKRYASLYFICAIDERENELITLELIHRYVQILDHYFKNVCEIDIIFNFQQAYALLDELVIAGELLETSKDAVFQSVYKADLWEQHEEIQQHVQHFV